MTPTTLLTMIAFRERDVITRCLAAFAPAFDYLSITIATGSSEPDETERLARDWCKANGKKIHVSHYTNAHPCAGVDDFAAARNFSLRQGLNRFKPDWWFWADADDIIEPAHAIGIRNATLIDNAPDVFLATYLCPQAGGCFTVERERLFRATVSGRWIRSVHEHFAFESKRIGKAGGLEFVHAPLATKDRDPERNLNILRREFANWGSRLWDMHREAFYAYAVAQSDDKLALCLDAGRACLCDQFLRPEERIQAYVNLALASPDMTEAKQYAHDCIRFDPSRREGYAVMAELELKTGNAERAIAWLDAMTAFPEPQTAGIPRGPGAYGFYGFELYTRALRATGQHERAVKLETESRAKVGEPVITVVHASRGRPREMKHARRRWMDAASQPARIQWVFAVEDDDTDSLAAVQQFEHVVNTGRTCVSAWNLGAAQTVGKIIVQMSDDWMPFSGWDDAITKAFPDLNAPAVLAIKDGYRKDALLCMAILTRARYEQQGYLFHPDYRGMYSDDEYTLRAYADGVVIPAPHIVFRHDHPVFTGKPMDEAYKRQNAPEEYAHGLEVFWRRNPGVATTPHE